jgi:hypothetical protein
VLVTLPSALLAGLVPFDAAPAALFKVLPS